MEEGAAGVLVVDDDAAMRMVCRLNLELDGLHVFEAATAQDAERLLNAENVGVVVTDLNVTTREDGLRFAQLVRSEHPNIGLVIMSGTRPAPSEPLDFADAVFTKPFDLTEFLETVKRLAERSRDDRQWSGSGTAWSPRS